ncbi:RES family NAD+ phosphorylase [Microvirga aerilata]|uniref:RES family NAD+ phosphorylase n=1 Tax=Microvirga aerilata TaxID=670292 RepID=A0A936ZEC1_9HYPH|nr:RES family NAD+ phosphorylase [Microvirga aerilata]MBL0406255.1 RES family NAD+ phosphorylase [Microvirga aerilata]
MSPSGPSGPRGPTGAAPPPAWLRRTRLPIDVLPAGTVLHRIHRTSLGPLFFGPGPGIPPTHRFDSATGRFGVLYVGLSRAGAVAETLLRNPQRLMVATSEFMDRAATELVCRRDLRVVKLYGAGLQAVGTDNAISTGPYEPCGLWSDALWDHPNQPDGIAYQSRHDSNELCLAFLERPDMTFAIQSTKPLTGLLHEIAALLDAYGKSLSPT